MNGIILAVSILGVLISIISLKKYIEIWDNPQEKTDAEYKYMKDNALKYLITVCFAIASLIGFSISSICTFLTIVF